MTQHSSSPNINRFLTDLCNGDSTITESQKKFLRKALQINLKERCTFCYDDFSEMSQSQFRQHIHKLKKHVVRAVKSKPCFYRIKGTPERISSQSVTDRPTGENMLRILRNAKEQPSSIHDVKIHTYCENMHEILQESGHIPDKNNSGIILPPLRFEFNTVAKVHVYPQLISVDIACTNKPLVYDVSGVVRLLLILGELVHELKLLSKYSVKLPPTSEWKIKAYHMGKDGTQSFSGQSGEMRLDEFASGSFRYYNKLGEDGKRKLRVEYTARPDQVLMREIENMIAAEEQYQDTYLDRHQVT